MLRIEESGELMAVMESLHRDWVKDLAQGQQWAEGLIEAWLAEHEPEARRTALLSAEEMAFWASHLRELRRPTEGMTRNMRRLAMRATLWGMARRSRADADRAQGIQGMPGEPTASGGRGADAGPAARLVYPTISHKWTETGMHSRESIIHDIYCIML